LRLLDGRAWPVTNLVLARSWFSHAYGWLRRTSRSRAEIAELIASVGSLDDFFTGIG
jgi:hypothetical protein